MEKARFFAVPVLRVVIRFFAGLRMTIKVKKFMTYYKR